MFYECLMYGLSIGALVGGFFLGLFLVVAVGGGLCVTVFAWAVDRLP